MYSYLSTVSYFVEAFDVWHAVGWVVLAVMLHGVWRLWRGMRPDVFERGLRTLREQRNNTVLFSRRCPSATTRTGFLQISLLPLMLLSCAVAMLLAQAQRPDDVSRSITWALFVSAGTWYSTQAWSHYRGLGPLRNHAWAGVASAACISALLWGFYLAVDAWWGAASVARITTSASSLLWWIAVGAVAGGLIGAFRASRIYGSLRIVQQPPECAVVDIADLVVSASPRSRRFPWSAAAVACCASLLFHASTVPQLYRVVDLHFWAWDWGPQFHGSNSLTLTMAAPSLETPVYARPVQIEVAGGQLWVTEQLLVDIETIDSDSSQFLNVIDDVGGSDLLIIVNNQVMLPSAYIWTVNEPGVVPPARPVPLIASFDGPVLDPEYVQPVPPPSTPRPPAGVFGGQASSAQDDPTILDTAIEEKIFRAIGIVVQWNPPFSEDGAAILRFLPQSSAAAAGLRANDEIRSIEGYPISWADQIGVVWNKPQVRILVRRGELMKTFTIPTTAVGDSGETKQENVFKPNPKF